MKSYYLYLSVVLFLFISCTSSQSGKFAGEWQHINDPSKRITITKSGKNYFFATQNIESSIQGIPGIYNYEKHALEFDNGAGTITTFVYNVSVKHLLALGEEFERSPETTVEHEETVETNTEETSDEASDPTPSDAKNYSDNASKCDKGDVLFITGNNVRLRTEPDVTKQNILMQLNRSNEVVHLDDKNVDGQKWYKVCFGGNIGWVSGQYVSMK